MAADLTERDLRTLFRKFRRTALRLREGLAALGDEDLQFSLKVDKGRAPVAVFNERPPLYRFAALLRPFMAPGSPLRLQTVWDTVAPLVSDETRHVMSQNFVAVEDLGIVIELNDKTLTTQDLYRAYADGEFFGDDPDAKDLLETLSFGAGAVMLPFLFYSACENYARLTFVLLDVITALEKSRPELASVIGTAQCIYCLEHGEFGTEEHVIPEAFGLDELVLVGTVCQGCNNNLSQLDQFLAEFEPLALLRVYNVPLTKKGKFPRADMRDFIVEKVKPRVLRFRSKTGKRVFEETELGNGVVRLRLNTTSKRPIDAITLARSVFKIALGIVAYDAGSEFACHPRFGTARAFIRGEGVMPNHLLMTLNVQPSARIATTWNPQVPTVVMIDIFGLKFVVNLDVNEIKLAPESVAEAAVAFWLGEITTKGVVKPCAANCCH